MNGKEISSCLICDKHDGVGYHPPGGFIFRGAYFSICHAPLEAGPAGTLFIESNRHFLDYSEMTPAELSAFGPLIGKVVKYLKEATQAERIYQVTMIDGIPHFHTWLVPRRSSDTTRGIRFLSQDLTSTKEEAQAIVRVMAAKPY